MMTFSQRDPKWKNNSLGLTHEYTIGTAGCLLTCMASVVADFGGEKWSAVTPGTLNTWLQENSGFSGALFVWSAVNGLGMHLDKLIQCATTPAPVAELQAALAADAAVVIEVDSQPGGVVQPHWVRLIMLGAYDGKIMDPWMLPGQEIVSLSKYFAPGWDAARAILAAAIYRPGAGATREVSAVDSALKYQERLALRPPEPEVTLSVESGPLTAAELACVQQLGEVWNAFCKLPVLCPGDEAEFLAVIHAAQNIVLARAGVRQINASLATDFFTV